MLLTNIEVLVNSGLKSKAFSSKASSVEKRSLEIAGRTQL